MSKRKAIITGIVTSILLVTLACVMLSKNSIQLWGKQSSRAPQSSEENTRSYDLNISENKLTSGPDTIKVKQGQKVQINIIPGDQDESEFLVQGYGQGGNVQTGSTAEFEFVADKQGSYPLMIVPEQEDDEPHHPNVQIGTLIVE